MRIQAAAGILQGLCRDQELCFYILSGRLPLQGAHGQTEAVRCRHLNILAVDIHVHASEHGQGVILAGCGCHLLDGLCEELRLDRAGDLRQDWQLRVIIERDER